MVPGHRSRGRRMALSQRNYRDDFAQESSRVKTGWAKKVKRLILTGWTKTCMKNFTKKNFYEKKLLWKKLL
jgi:hypothetical protein